MSQLTLKQLIDFLESHNQDLVIHDGFGQGSSYRGYNDQVAFEPARFTKVSAMLQDAKAMLGKRIYGKSQHGYVVTEETLVNIADYNDCGGDEDEITMERLETMFQDWTKNSTNSFVN